MNADPATSGAKARAPHIQPVVTMVRARGLMLQFTRWHIGSGGKPLLFLNGVGASSADAAPLLRRITGREVWTIDMPGTGGSPDCFWPYSAQSMAEAVMDVVAQHSSGPIDLAGFSWGGALAQQIAGQFSARVDHLILLATASQIDASDIGWGAIWDWDILKNSLRMPTASALGLTYQSLAMAGWSSDRLLPRIADHKILILGASQDHVVPSAHARRLVDKLQDAEYVQISGGHLFPFTKAEETAAHIAEFLNAASATQAAA